MRTYQTLEHVCKSTGKHRVTIMRWVASGQFPAPIKPAGALLFAVDDIEAWEAKQREKAKAFVKEKASREADGEEEAEDEDEEAEAE